MKNKKLMCKNKIAALFIAFLYLVSILSACGTKTDANDSESSDLDNSNTTVYANTSSAEIDGEGNISIDVSDAATITFSNGEITVTGKGVTENKGVVTISDGGTYVISGESSDGRIIVNAPDEEVVLVLDNVSLECPYGSPIYIYKSDLATINLADESTNSLTDGSEYTFEDSLSSAVDEEPNACLYSKSDLVISGKGQLIVNANYNNGITSKDTLNIEDCDIAVNAAHHGINGKDCCIVKNAVLNIVAGGDTLRSTNDSDTTLGYISISDSTLELNAGEDAIQAVTSVEINGGAYTIVAGDDGIHSDGNTTIVDGSINIIESYEGIEGQVVDISGGIINIVASDDGINASDGSNQEEFGPPQGGMFGSSDCCINISGGVITVDASGDGIDSNGNLYVSGGELYVSGPLDNGNSALDYDGEGTISGGIVVAADSGGMAQNFGGNSTQGCIMLSFAESTGEKICARDSGGNILVSYTPTKNYSCVVISCPEIEVGKSYNIEAANQTTSITMESLIYGNPGGPGQGGLNPGGHVGPGGHFDGGKTGMP